MTEPLDPCGRIPFGFADGCVPCCCPERAGPCGCRDGGRACGGVGSGGPFPWGSSKVRLCRKAAGAFVDRRRARLGARGPCVRPRWLRWEEGRWVAGGGEGVEPYAETRATGAPPRDGAPVDSVFPVRVGPWPSRLGDGGRGDAGGRAAAPAFPVAGESGRVQAASVGVEAGAVGGPQQVTDRCFVGRDGRLDVAFGIVVEEGAQQVLCRSLGDVGFVRRRGARRAPRALGRGRPRP